MKRIPMVLPLLLPEQLGSYSDYLTQKKPAATYKEPLLAGGIFILASLFLTIAFY